MLASVRYAPTLSGVAFVSSRVVIDQDVDVAMNLAGWGPVDDQLTRLGQQAEREVTVLFDLLTAPGWAPRRHDAGMDFMHRFRRVGVMKLRSFGEDVAVYRPRA